MSNLDDWFPLPESQSVTVRQAWEGMKIDTSGLGLTPLYQKYWKETKPGESLGKLQSTKKLSFDRPAFTITKSEGNGGLYHPSECRMLHHSEFKRLASFLDDYFFAGKRKDKQERIGNSVPPLFMYSIARNIKSMLQTGKPHRQEVRTGKIDYPAHLAAMWEKAITPRADDAPTVISTFAGGGGSSTGYMMAGFRELLAVEWDDNAVQTLRLNYPHLDIYHGDIAKLSVEEVLRRTGLQPGQLDVFDGSPPCQGFSTAGKRDFDDDRNQLFREYVRLLRGLQPKVFVMENVSGMVKGKMKLIFVEILQELKASGYKVSARLLNAMYFHVPQSRERMIFVGVREDLGIEPSHPKAESQPITVRDAFSYLPTLDIETPVAWATNPNWAVSKYIPLIKEGKSCDDVHPKKAGFNLVRLDSKKPSPTIPKTCNGSLFAGLLPPMGDRYCSIGELKRLGSFPDKYLFSGEFGEQWARIGNSVPPLLMEAIARNIRLEILSKL